MGYHDAPIVRPAARISDRGGARYETGLGWHGHACVTLCLPSMVVMHTLPARLLFAMSIVQHLDFFEGDQAFADHFVDVR